MGHKKQIRALLRSIDGRLAELNTFVGELHAGRVEAADQTVMPTVTPAELDADYYSALAAYPHAGTERPADEPARKPWWRVW
jgi:hypothetical protein